MTRMDSATRHSPAMLGSEDVGSLANKVIAVICERQSCTESGVRTFLADYLLRSVLSDDGFDAGSMFAELRGHRLSTDELIDLYVPLVAHRLGDMWMNDTLSFADVTIGSMRLQSLLGVASAEQAPVIWRPGALQLGALVVVPEGEQHFLGASAVSAQLRRLGVTASVSISEREAEILARIEMEAPDMVLFSVARVQALDVVERNVKTIKAAIRPAPVLAIGGALRGDPKGIMTKTGVDLVAEKSKEVVGFCTKRLQALNRD